MKKLVFLIIILFSINFTFAQNKQQKTLQQAEYVKMLYDLQKNPGSRDALIEAIRMRGIGFELTDGLRSLTRTKSKNDSEIQRTLEEANRRRMNPGAAQLPAEKEIKEVLEKTRTNTLAAVEEMPDFTVKQLVARSYAYAGTNNYRNLDRLVVAVNYRSSGREEYKLLSRNGVLENNPTSKQTYSEVGGTSSTGEFVTVLAKIFKTDSDTKFEIVDTDTIRNRPALVFKYSITVEKAQQLITAAGAFNDSVITGMEGKIWIDRSDFRVLRIESAATDIPESFRIRSANRVIDYDWVTISDEKFLLPSVSDVRLTSRENGQIYETRNVIRFKEYQKYGSEVTIVEEDNTPEEKPE